MKQKYDDLIGLLLFIFGQNKSWDLNHEPITVRFSEMDNHRMEITRLAVDRDRHLWITDGPDENCAEITEDHRYVSVIVEAVNTRLRRDFQSIIRQHIEKMTA